MKIIILFLLLGCSALFAAVPPVASPGRVPAPVDNQISISFDKISVLALVNFAYGDILKQNFAVHPDLVDFPKLVTVHFQGDFDKVKLAAFVVDLLAEVGVTVEKKRGYVFVRPVVVAEDEEPEQEIFFYRAKYRPVSFLMDITGGLFKTGHFSTQRAVKGVDSAALVLPVKPVATASPGQKSAKPVQDSGSSAFSQIEKIDSDFFVFQGLPKEIQTLQKLLSQVDVPVGEVLVKGMVYEVTTGAKDGSAFSLAVNVLQGNLGVNLGQVLKGGDSLRFGGAGINAVFSALASDSRFKSISNPSLRVKSGAAARFSVGSDVPVLGQVQLDRNGNAIQSVEYKPSGVIFDLKPQIRDEVIDLVISQQLSSFVVTTTGLNNTPTLIKREISTMVGASDGDVILLGGLDEEKTTTDSNGLPFLPAWARSKGGDSSKTQILLVLQVQKI